MQRRPPTPQVQQPARDRGRGWRVLLLALLAASAGSQAVRAAPPKPVQVVVVGWLADAGRPTAAALGARIAATQAPRVGPLAGGVEVVLLDDGGSERGLQTALGRLRSIKPAAVLALPTGDLEARYAQGAQKVPAVWTTLTGRAPDVTRWPPYVLHLGPTPVAQGLAAADGMLAPLAARRVAVVHEATGFGTELAAAFARNLGRGVTLAGTRAWGPDEGPEALGTLRGLEAEWIYVAMGGAPLHRFVEVLGGSDWRPKLLFAHGARDETLLALGGEALSGAVFLGGPDPEMHGREGERFVDQVLRAGAPRQGLTARAYEATRRVLRAVTDADSTKLKRVLEAYRPETPHPGVLGELRFDPHGAVRAFPFTWWRVEQGRLEVWPGGLLPTPGCGPPLGFGTPRTAEVNDHGKIGYLTWGPPDRRTIERDLLAIGLSTGGADPELDEIVRREIQGRAIRIANRLFRREADGTPTPGWSWGMAFALEEPGEEVKRGRVWPAVCAGDHEAAGGQAFGSWVAVYTTFLRRTMYESRKLDPPLSTADRKLLDGTCRWGVDRSANFRADKIRCLLDGFASAMGLTLSHEFGHLCGCGHDTEHPTSIMNVVAGAGASWEEAVWIPAHQRDVTRTLGVEPARDERSK